MAEREFLLTPEGGLSCRTVAEDIHKKVVQWDDDTKMIIGIYDVEKIVDEKWMYELRMPFSMLIQRFRD